MGMLVASTVTRPRCRILRRILMLRDVMDRDSKKKTLMSRGLSMKHLPLFLAHHVDLDSLFPFRGGMG